MPWIALPFEDRQRKQQLSTAFKVSGIPTLVIMNDKFRVINNNGRSVRGVGWSGVVERGFTLLDLLRRLRRFEVVNDRRKSTHDLDHSLLRSLSPTPFLHADLRW